MVSHTVRLCNFRHEYLQQVQQVCGTQQISQHDGVHDLNMSVEHNMFSLLWNSTVTFLYSFLQSAFC